MAPEPVPGSGRDEDPARRGDPGDPRWNGEWRLLPPPGVDWMDDEQWAASSAAWAGELELDDPDLEEDPDHSPPGLDASQQHPRWNADRLPDGTIRWTAPSGRTYTTEPTQYPI